MAEFVRLNDTLGKTVRALKALPRELSGSRGGPVRAALAGGARLIRDQARENTPVGVGTPAPGNMRRQIFMYRDRNPQALGLADHYIVTVRSGRRGRKRLRLGGTGRSALSVIGGDAYYWFMVEFGTSKQPAQRPLTRAFEAKKQAAVNEFSRILARGVAAAEARARKAGGF